MTIIVQDKIGVATIAREFGSTGQVDNALISVMLNIVVVVQIMELFLEISGLFKCFIGSTKDKTSNGQQNVPDGLGIYVGSVCGRWLGIISEVYPNLQE
jgi:hypothetical protein